MRRLVILAALGAAACGGSDFDTDPGSGTRTLLVNGDVDYESGGADIRVRVQRAGVDVPDAVVIVESDFGRLQLVYVPGDGEYVGTQAGWAAGYYLSVDAGEDELDGTIAAPDPVVITEPNPQAAIDPHNAEGGLIHVVWAGDTADSARVKTKDFEMTLAPDPGELDIPAPYFVEDQQDIEIRRRNHVDLAGGAPGSDLEASYEDKVRVIVTNPF